MEELRIDCAHPTTEEKEITKHHTQTLFRLNHTMSGTEEFESLVHDLFPDMGQGSRNVTPLSGVPFNNVKIGKNVVIQCGCMMMSAGGITIEDDAMMAANVQLISNNYDLDNRWIIT